MKQKTKQCITWATALALLSGTMLPMTAAAEGEDIQAQVQAVSDANDSYDVTVSPFTVNADNTGTQVITYYIGSGLFGVQINDYVFTDPENPEVQATSNAFAVVDKNGETIIPLRDVGSGYNCGYFEAFNGVLSLMSNGPEMGLELHDPALIRSLYPDKEFADGEIAYGSVEYYDLEGNVLFEHEPYFCGSTMTEYAWVGLTNTEADSQAVTKEYQIINAKGETVAVLSDEITAQIQTGYAGPTTFYDGLAPYYIIDTERTTEEEYFYHAGFLDTNGNFAIEPTYDDVTSFCNGRAVVTDSDGKRGLIDKTGNFVIEPAVQNFWLSAASDYFWIQNEDEQWSVIDRDGTPQSEILPFEPYTGFKKAYAAVQTQEGIGYIDHTGNIVIPCEYENAFNDNETFFSVQKDGKYGVIDKNNNVVVPLIFDDISAVGGDTAIASSGEELYILHITAEAAEPTILGDVTGDNLVNASDAAQILIAAAEIGAGNAPTLSAAQQKMADVDGNGTINALDAAIVLQYAAAVGAGDKDAKIEDFIGA